jgi:hypothetical protein
MEMTFSGICIPAWTVLHMSRHLFFIPFLFCICCFQAERKNNKPVRSLKNETSAQPAFTIDYKSAVQKVKACRDSLQLVYKKAGVQQQQQVLSVCEQLFTQSVVNELIPYWYGTPWDFNGTTQEPGKGQIACGYFITTILRDAGIPIERIKLAQSPSSVIIKKMADKNSIRSFSLQPVEKVVQTVKKMGVGLYIAGLDFHTGFLYYDGYDVYFIHSNYINRQGVIKEPADHSAAFNHTKYRVIGKISNNKSLLKNWLGL